MGLQPLLRAFSVCFHRVSMTLPWLIFSCRTRHTGRNSRRLSSGIARSFGITKPDTPAWSWFSKCKTISSPTVAVAGGPVVTDTFCRASSFQEAVEIYLQLIKENPRASKLHASTSLPHNSWSEKELTMIAANAQRAEFRNGSSKLRVRCDEDDRIEEIDGI